jgi:hypothetical protein
MGRDDDPAAAGDPRPDQRRLGDQRVGDVLERRVVGSRGGPRPQTVAQRPPGRAGSIVRVGLADQHVPDRVENREAARRRRGRRRSGRDVVSGGTGASRNRAPRSVGAGNVGPRCRRRAAADRCSRIPLGEIRDEQRVPVRRPGHLARTARHDHRSATRRRRAGGVGASTSTIRIDPAPSCVTA